MSSAAAAKFQGVELASRAGSPNALTPGAPSPELRRWDLTWGSPPQLVSPRDAAREIFSSGPTQDELELRAPLVRQRGRPEDHFATVASKPSRSRDEEEVVELSQNGYTLVLVSGSLPLFVCMCFVAVGQLGVLWLIAFSSPEYFFESGQWIVPFSDFWSVNAMKGFSLLLMLFRVTGEFKDATKMCRVVFHDLKEPLGPNQRMAGISALVMQYLVAVLVLFMAIHLILACTTPIGTIGKLWVVYMVLEFDNRFCDFVLYTCHLDDAFNWKVCILHPDDDSPTESQWIWCYGIPVAVGLLLVALSFVLRVCPVTLLHYGLVRNDDPVLMLSSNLGLPGGCCSPQVAWDERAAGEPHTPATISVPCLSPGPGLPEVYYVVLPDGRVAPSSLQVLEGRGGDNNLALRRGKVQTERLQMHWWLSVYGFPHHGVYEALQGHGAGGLGLYRSNMPYVAHWEIADFPWESRVRIFATAMNPVTGALSPTPVQSAVILRKLCPIHCAQCASHGGDCWACERGFIHVQGRCEACLPGCDSCDKAGPGRCDHGHCGRGRGLARFGTSCLPCAAADSCLRCDVAAAFSEAATGSAEVLPCQQCVDGHGLTAEGVCVACTTPNCSTCSKHVQDCETCSSGFSLVAHEGDNVSAAEHRCEPCAEHCSACSKLGPGKCDPEMCDPGYSLSPTGKCAVCSAHCQNCTTAGPGKCDLGQCKGTYGLQGFDRCSKCLADHCQVCDSGGDVCDACAEGYGLTPEKTCEACADSCKRCTDVGDCAECQPSFGLHHGRCYACADQCLSCQDAGPGYCDLGGCIRGWTTTARIRGANASLTCVQNGSAAT